MSFKEDLLRTVETFMIGGPFPHRKLQQKCKLADLFGLRSLFSDYVEEHKLPTGYINPLCYNPLMHMLGYVPCISCFYQNESTFYTISVDSHKQINYILNEDVTRVNGELRWIYPDSIMMAWALGKLPELLKLYSNDIDKVLHGGNKSLTVN